MDVWYIKLTLYKSFLNWKKTSKKSSSYWQNSVVCDKSILYSLFHVSFISSWHGILVWKWCVFNISTFNLKTIQFFEKGFRFSGNWFQSENIEKVQNFHWLSYKNMLIAKMGFYFENPYCMLFLLASKAHSQIWHIFW